MSWRYSVNLHTITPTLRLLLDVYRGTPSLLTFPSPAFLVGGNVDFILLFFFVIEEVDFSSDQDSGKVENA